MQAMREIDCPRCGSKMTVLDEQLAGDGWDKWIVVKVVCHGGCTEFAADEIPGREDWP